MAKRKQPAKGKGRLWEKPFLKALAQSANVSWAVAQADVSKSAVYDYRNRSKEFAAAWDEAIEEARDALLQEAWRRGVEGVEEPVFFKDEQITTIKKYSDSVLLRLLQAYHPDKFERNLIHKHEHKHNHKHELQQGREGLYKALRDRVSLN